MLIQKQKEELKYVLYAFCRLILWNFIYKYWLKCLVRFSVVAFGMMFWERPSEQPYSLACAIFWGIAINKESWIYILIGFVIQYFITFFAIKPSLKKVFFKKYEKFELTPNFDKIS